MRVPVLRSLRTKADWDADEREGASERVPWLVGDMFVPLADRIEGPFETCVTLCRAGRSGVATKCPVAPESRMANLFEHTRGVGWGTTGK